MLFQFNAPDGGGILTGRAAIGAEDGFTSAPSSLHLVSARATPFGPSSTFSTFTKQLALVPGKPYPVQFYARCSQVYGAAFVKLDDGVAEWTALLPSTPSAGWTLVSAGNYQPQAADVTLEISALPTFGQAGQGAYAVDDLLLDEDTGEADVAPLDREPIYAALFARLQASLTGVNLFSRRLRHWSNVAAVAQPAVFLTIGDQLPQNRLDEPTLWLLVAELFLYVRMDDPNAVPGTRLNGLLKQIDGALEWRPADLVAGQMFTARGRQQTTLGGLVQYAWVTDVVAVEGVSTDQAAVKVSIEMLSAATVVA